MTTDNFNDQLAFLKEVDELKSIVRASPILNKSRKENSAEHSWHLALYALVLTEHASQAVNIDRVIRMLLIHDIVEIDAGDTPLHSSQDTSEQESLEKLAADRIFGLLPPHQSREFRALWDEFEVVETEDAKFAKSLDRLQPLIHNIETDGGTWNEHGLSQQQVFERYGPQIETGSVTLWERASQLVQSFFQNKKEL